MTASDPTLPRGAGHAETATRGFASVPLLLLGLAAWLAAAPAGATAQTLAGRVLDDGTGLTIPGTTVLLLDSAGTSIRSVDADSAGWYVLPLPRAGSYRLFIAQLGYGDITTPGLPVGDAELVHVDIRLAPAPVSLDPLVVSARGRRVKLIRNGFYDRNRSGFGYFMDQYEIDEHRAFHISDVLRTIPGVRVAPGAGADPDLMMRAPLGSCRPLLVLDEARIQLAGGMGIDSYVRPSDVMGMEVYTSAATAPARYRDPWSRCGVIVIWTR